MPLLGTHTYNVIVQAQAAHYPWSEKERSGSSASITKGSPSLVNVELEKGILSWDTFTGAANYCVTVGTTDYTITETSFNVRKKLIDTNVVDQNMPILLSARDASGNPLSQTWVGWYNTSDDALGYNGDFNIPSGCKGMPYEGKLNIYGGKTPYIYDKVSGPDWLKIDESTGKISGYYDGSGSNDDLVVRVTDADGASLDIIVPVGDTTPAYCQHKLTKHDAAPATLNSNGSKVYWECTMCNTYFSDENAQQMEPKNSWIIPQITSIKLRNAKVIYDNNNKSVSLMIQDAKGDILKGNMDYVVTYSSATRKNVGKYTCTIIFKGNYKGNVKKSFQILPKTAGVKSISIGKKKMTVKAKAKPVSLGGKYYQFAYKKKGTSTWKYTTTSTTSKTIKKLKKGSRYYTKVRVYKKVGSTTYYGNWSSTKLSKKIK